VLIEGQPIIVVKKGQIMEEELRKVRLDAEALKMLLRKKNVFSVADVDYAIFETDGSLSVLMKEAQTPATKQDLGVPPAQTAHAPATAVIADGRILIENLRKLELDEAWLQAQLQASGVGDLSEVFYAEVNPNGSLYVDKRNDALH
jgi:uncharacterized membrane protein YcaP (DUF421 family)